VSSRKRANGGEKPFTKQQEQIFEAMQKGLQAGERPSQGGVKAQDREHALEQYPEAYSLTDLTSSAEDLDRGTEFKIPGDKREKRVWIYPLSPEDSQDVTIWLTPGIRATARRLRLTTSQEDQETLSQVMQADLQVMQVIACCRMGPLRVHPRCFDPENAPTIKKYMPLGTVAQICRICDTRSHSFDPLQEAIQAFFTDAQSFFSTFSSALSTGSTLPPGFVELASDLASRAGRLATPEGRLSVLVT